MLDCRQRHERGYPLRKGVPRRLEVGGLELRRPNLVIRLELVPLLADQGRVQFDDGRTCPEEVDSHWALQQRRVPEQLAFEESDDAQRGDGRAIVGDE